MTLLRIFIVTGTLLAGLTRAARAENSAPIPTPLPGHPGNLFLSGEDATLAVPPGKTNIWRLVNYEERTLADARASEGHLALGRLPVGWYRVRHVGDAEAEWISLGVIPPLMARTPASSPIALDVAMAWFYPADKMDAVANLCALAGVSWVRDRLNWGEMEPRRQTVRTNQNRYDLSARAQAQAGLQVLQVNHNSPGWANPETKRFPLDLRDAYAFYREMARRWKGQVTAFEPWNEADIIEFGGHTGAEIAALQKASYLGLKAGNPDLVVCQNVFATHRPAQLEDFQENAAWPYFDTFNLHHYESFEKYPQLYAAFRAVSAGRPLWVTECALPVKWSGDANLKEPSDADLRIQAERLPKTFALSIHEGSAATFYFMLPHYVEGQTQFGIIRPDLTPRPALLSLATVGRLLADAKPLGRLQSTNAALHAYLFRAKPDGQTRSVLVAWSTAGKADLTLPQAPEMVVDHLGRTLPDPQATVSLGSAPVLAILPNDERLSLTPPPAPPERLSGKPSLVVLQALFSSSNAVMEKSTCRIASEKPERISLFAYNFGQEVVRGRLRLQAPQDWSVSPLGEVELQPMERKEIPITVTAPAARKIGVAKLRVAGDFGAAGQPSLGFRLLLEPNRLSPRVAKPVVGADEPGRWQKMISGDGPMQMSAQDGGVLIEAKPAGADRWVYPRFVLAQGEQVPPGAQGLSCALQVLEGNGQFRAIFDQANGASYVADLANKPKPGQTVTTVALFEEGVFGQGWSKPDPNGHLDPDQIRSFKIGCNPGGAQVKFLLKDLKWIEF